MLVVAFYHIAFSVMYVIYPCWIHIVCLPPIDFTFCLQSCTQLPNGSYTKDLSLVEADLSRVCLVDNSPVSYTVNEGSHDDFIFGGCFAILMPAICKNSKWNTHWRLDAWSLRWSFTRPVARSWFLTLYLRCSACAWTQIGWRILYIVFNCCYFVNLHRTFPVLPPLAFCLTIFPLLSYT